MHETEEEKQGRMICQLENFKRMLEWKRMLACQMHIEDCFHGIKNWKDEWENGDL